MLGAHAMPENLDQARFAIEQLPADVYLASGYFERWLLAGEAIFEAQGALDAKELSARRASLVSGSRLPLSTSVDQEQACRLTTSLRTGIRTRRTLPARPRFSPGDTVVASTDARGAHTRLPGYVRGKSGLIDRVHGAFDLPEHAVVGEQVPEYLYEVRFDGHELWGATCEPRTCVFIQLWDSYLEAV